MDLQGCIRERLAGHTCYEGCDNLLCLSNREIKRLSENFGYADAAITLALAHPEAWEDVLRAYYEHKR